MHTNKKEKEQQNQTNELLWIHIQVHIFLLLQMLLMSRETIRLIKDGEPRTTTSTFTQLLSSQVYACFPSANKCVCVLKWSFFLFSFFLFLLLILVFHFMRSVAVLVQLADIRCYLGNCSVRSVWHHLYEKTWNKKEEERMEPRDFCSTEK